MIAIKDREIPKGCQKCMFFRKHLFGNGLDYSYSCVLGATEIPMPWIRQMEERASDCPLVEIVTCKDCKHCYPDEDGRGYHCEKSDTERIPTCADFYCIHGERRE